MALLFMESFDGYGGTAAHATKWSTMSGLGTSSPAPRTGTHRVASVGTGIVRPISPGSATLIVGVAFYWSGINQGSVILWPNAAPFGTFAQCALTLDEDSKVSVRAPYNNSAALGTSADAVLVTGSWNFIEWKITVANAGSYEVKVNGISVLSGSGDTQGQTATGVGSMTFVTGTFNGFDDLYVLDSTGSMNNDFIGDCKVERISPQAGNGANVGLTPSNGTDHGAMVDELPANDDTDYNAGSTAGVKDTYVFGDLASTGVVKAVQLSVRAKKTDSPTKQLALVTRLGGVDYDSATQAVASTTYGQYQQILETRPSDGGTWTVADVNGAEFGLKVVS